MEILHVDGFLGANEVTHQHVIFVFAGSDDLRRRERNGWSSASRQKHRQRSETLLYAHREAVGEQQPLQRFGVLCLHPRVKPTMLAFIVAAAAPVDTEHQPQEHRHAKQRQKYDN